MSLRKSGPNEERRDVRSRRHNDAKGGISLRTPPYRGSRPDEELALEGEEKKGRGRKEARGREVSNERPQLSGTNDRVDQAKVFKGGQPRNPTTMLTVGGHEAHRPKGKKVAAVVE